MKCNANDYISHILDPLAEWRSSQVGGSGRGLHIHTDNARPPAAKKVTEFLAGNGMERAAHPPYSLDLAPCDFYLFGYIQDRLAGASFEEDGQIGAVLCGSWWFSRRYVKNLRMIQVLLDQFRDANWPDTLYRNCLTKPNNVTVNHLSRNNRLFRYTRLIRSMLIVCNK
jgi:hypothetical protein